MTEQGGQFRDAREHVKQTSTWTRGLYIVLFSILFNLAEIIIAAVVVFQFLHTLFTGKPNPRLLTFGQSLSTYAYQILTYISYNSDHRPYPLGAWPKGAPAAGSARKRSSAAGKSEETAPDDQETP